jgi:hypothetical protein
VAIVGADDDAEPEPGEVRSVLVPVLQRSAQQVQEHGVDPEREPGPSLKQVAVVVVLPGQQVSGIGVGGQRLVPFSAREWSSAELAGVDIE